MPRTAVYVLSNAFLTQLRQLGFVAANTNQVRIDARHGLPARVLTDRGGSQAAGTIIDADAFLGWIRAEVARFDEAGLALGCYIDSPNEVTDESALTPRGQLTDAIMTQAIAGTLNSVTAVR